VDGLLVVVRLQSLRSATLDELERTLAATPTAKLGVVVTGAPATGGMPNRRYGPARSAVVQMTRTKDGDEQQPEPENGSVSVRNRVRRWT
jgi:hypothetical protein